MMERLLRGLMKNHIIANILVILILAGGFIAVKSNITEKEPIRDLNIVEVFVPYPGADPAEADEAICIKLDNALSGIEGVKYINTYAGSGYGQAFINGKDNYDIHRLKEDIQSAVEQIRDFPKDTEKPRVNIQESDNRVMCLYVFSDLPENQYRDFLIDFEEQLLRLPSVSKTLVAGMINPEINIDVSEKTLKKYGLTFDDINKAIQDNGLNVSTGMVKSKAENIKLKVVGRKYEANDYLDIPVIAKSNGTIVKLGQIAEISENVSVSYKNAFYYGDNAENATVVWIYKTKNEDAVQISKDVRALVNNIQNQIPDSIKIRYAQDLSQETSELISSTVKNGIIGLLLVILILTIFLGFNLSFWVAMGIPVSISGAFIVMSLTGVTINFFSLVSMILIVGIVVDDGIVISESIHNQVSEGEVGTIAAINGTLSVLWPVIVGVLTTMFALTPLLFMPGSEGKINSNIATVIIAALSFSLVEALFILPVHLRNLKIKKENNNGNLRFLQKIKSHTFASLNFFSRKIYKPAIIILLNWRYASVSAALAILFLVCGLVIGDKIKFNYQIKDSNIIGGTVILQPGTPLSTSKKVVEKLTEAWERVNDKYRMDDGVELTKTWIGGGGNSVFFVENIILNPEDRDVSNNTLLYEWNKELGEIPEIVSSNFGANTGGIGSSIHYNVYGDDQSILLEAANAIVDKLNTYEGVYDAQTNYRYGEKMLQITLKPLAAFYNLSVRNIADKIKDGFEGRESVKIQRGKEEISVNLRYLDHGRNSLKYLMNMKIQTPEGILIPVTDVADFSFVETPEVIYRNRQQISISISAKVNTEIITSTQVMNDVEKDFLPQIAGLYGISYTQEGGIRESKELIVRLQITIPLALLAIYFIMVIVFKSYLQPVIIMTTIPFAVLGAVIGLLIFRIPLSSPPAMLGIIALLGIVVNDGIVLINEVNKNLVKGDLLFASLCKAGKRRLQSILLTSITTLVGMAPLVLSKTTTGQDIAPMAVAISFGLLFSTVVTLFLVPCFYAILNDLRRIVYVVWNLKYPTREEVEPRAVNSEK